LGLRIGSEEVIRPPSAHRTVCTGPYTALYVKLTYFRRSCQCGWVSFDRMSNPISWINHLFGKSLSTPQPTLPKNAVLYMDFGRIGC